jgi:chromate transport protein ChrA
MRALENRPAPSGKKRLKRSGLAGTAIGLVALLACKLPVVLAMVGLGGLGAGAMAFRPPPVVEAIAIVMAVVGTGLLLTAYLRRNGNK